MARPMPLGVWDWGLVRCWLTPRAACLQLPNRPLRFGRKSLGVAQSLVPFTRATHFGYLFLTHTTGGDSLAWLFARLRLPLEYMEKAGDFCQQHNLKLHVDGARLWNAAVALKARRRPTGCNQGNTAILSGSPKKTGHTHFGVGASLAGYPFWAAGRSETWWQFVRLDWKGSQEGLAHVFARSPPMF